MPGAEIDATEMLVGPLQTIKSLLRGRSDDMPEKAQAIIALKSFGLSNMLISRQLGLPESSVRYNITRYDPDGLASQANELRKAYIGLMFETVAAEALSSIKPHEIMEMKPLDKVRLASTCARALDSLKAKLPDRDRETAEEIATRLAKKMTGKEEEG